jgi:hypothetical protein
MMTEKPFARLIFIMLFVVNVLEKMNMGELLKKPSELKNDWVLK